VPGEGCRENLGLILIVPGGTYHYDDVCFSLRDELQRHHGGDWRPVVQHHRSERQVDCRDRVLEFEAMLVDPAEGLLNPSELSEALIVEDAERDQIDTRGQTRMATVVGSDDSGYVRAVKAGRAVVVRVRIVFGKVPPTDDAVPAAEPAAEGNVVVSDATVDDGDCLVGAGQTELLA
jgi:hypothetical protein